MESREERLKKLKEKYIKKGIRFYECPVCREIYKEVNNVIKCGYCGKLDKRYKYTSNGKTIVKIKNETNNS